MINVSSVRRMTTISKVFNGKFLSFCDSMFYITLNREKNILS